jgi:hypothetical protein
MQAVGTVFGIGHALVELALGFQKKQTGRQRRHVEVAIRPDPAVGMAFPQQRSGTVSTRDSDRHRREALSSGGNVADLA